MITEFLGLTLALLLLLAVPALVAGAIILATSPLLRAELSASLGLDGAWGGKK